MNFFARMFNAWRSPTNPDKGLQQSGPPVRPSETGTTVTDDRALSVSAVWACVRLLVESIATLPLTVYEQNDDGSRDEAPKSNYLARLLTVRPNGLMNPKEARMALATQRVLWGNAYALIARDVNGIPRGLMPLNPANMTVDREPGQLIYHYSSEAYGQRKFYNRDGELPEIFHWRGFSADGTMGLSPLAYAAPTMGLTVAASRSAAKAFTGRPNGVLTTDTVLTPDQRAKLRELYSNVGGSEIGDNQWWLLEGGFSYQAIGIPPDDLQMLESRQFQVAEICRFYGVPTVMVDGNAGATSAWPASYEQQVLAFLTFCLKPYLEEFESKVQETLVIKNSRIYAEHNVEGFLRADSKARASYYSTMVQNGIMTRNEVRRRENLKPLEGLDEATIQLNLTPAQDLGKEDDRPQNV